MKDWLNEKDIKRIIEEMENLERLHKEHNVNDHYEVHSQITDIIGYIQDCAFWGTLVDLETGISMINDLLKDIDDEKFVSYEKNRLDKTLQLILK